MNGAFAPDYAVVIGSFQPVHNGHVALLRHALMRAPSCIVVIGSAYQAPSPTHPFTWQERAQMILAALCPDERSRIQVVAVRDHYLDARWASAVRKTVSLAVGSGKTIALMDRPSVERDDHQFYFVDWKRCDALWQEGVSADALRDMLFDPDRASGTTVFDSARQQAPPSTIAFLLDWRRQPAFETLRLEWQMLQDYKSSWALAPYPPVLFTVDCVVRSGLHVLLIRRAHMPGKGLLGVPGGFMEINESALHTAFRELEEETHLDVPLAQLRESLKEAVLFDRPGRSGRGRTLTHVHYFDLGERALPKIRAGDDAAAAAWTLIRELPALESKFMDDHFQMLDHFLDLDLGRP